MPETVLHSGQCHCGAVQFEFDGTPEMSVTHCNCSLCSLTGFEHVFVPKADFRIIKGADNLTTYTFNTHTAKHLFCKTCGIKAFYHPRSHPKSYSVHLKAIRPGTLTVSEVIDFDGGNWEDNISGLREKV